MAQCDGCNGAKSVKHLQTSTNIYKHLQTSTNIYKHLQTSTNIYKNEKNEKKRPYLGQVLPLFSGRHRHAFLHQSFAFQLFLLFRRRHRPPCFLQRRAKRQLSFPFPFGQQTNQPGTRSFQPESPKKKASVLIIHVIAFKQKKSK
jgi:hypothetical protein